MTNLLQVIGVLMIMGLFIMGSGLFIMMNDWWGRHVIDPIKFGPPGSGWFDSLKRSLIFYAVEAFLCFFAAAITVAMLINILNALMGGVLQATFAFYSPSSNAFGSGNVSGLSSLGVLFMPTFVFALIFFALLADAVIYNMPLIVYGAIVGSFALKLLREGLSFLFGVVV